MRIRCHELNTVLSRAEYLKVVQQLIQHLLATRKRAAGNCLMARERCGGEGGSARGKNSLSPPRLNPPPSPWLGASAWLCRAREDAEDATDGEVPVALLHSGDVHLSPPLKLDVNWKQVADLGGKFPQQQVPMS